MEIKVTEKRIKTLNIELLLELLEDFKQVDEHGFCTETHLILLRKCFIIDVS